MYTYEAAPPPPEKPGAIRTYTVTDGDRPLGLVALEINSRPTGETERRDWWPIDPERPEDTPQRAYGTRAAAAQHLSHAWHHRHRKPTPPPEDRTLTTIQHTLDQAGAAAAAWLAASITAHHLRTLAEDRYTHPAAIWREIARATTWLEVATLPHHETDAERSLTER